MLEKHDWQASMLSDPNFLVRTARPEAHSVNAGEARLASVHAERPELPRPNCKTRGSQRQCWRSTTGKRPC